MKRSQRGMAKVSVVWAICLFMAFAAAAVAYFLSNQEAASQRDLAAQYETKMKKAESERDTLNAYVLEVSKKAGFTDPTNPSRMDAKTLDEGLKYLKDNCKSIEASATTVQAAMKYVVEDLKKAEQRAQESTTRAEQLAGENNQIRGNVDSVRTELEKQLGDMRRQLSDEQQSFNDQKGELERQLAERTATWQQTDKTKNDLAKEVEDTKRKAALEADAWRTRMAEAERKLTPFTKEPEAADGRLLSISPELKLGWVDIGSKHRLARGMRFRVVDGQHGSKKMKGWCEVTAVQNEMAEVTFSEQVDPFDPPSVGDVVFNPLFDPKGERSAVLIGRFSGALTEEALKAMLKSMNISVTKSVERTTDFLIVGGEMYKDPENGQPLEAPLQPSDDVRYKNAQAEGVQIVTLKELRQYFASN
ncbi:MAG: hypothetical protein HZA53_09430 [Planctomycetes bacterium]|nr:hypothetical protein [Planctomycetota bacterium]